MQQQQRAAPDGPGKFGVTICKEPDLATFTGPKQLGVDPTALAEDPHPLASAALRHPLRAAHHIGFVGCMQGIQEGGRHGIELPRVERAVEGGRRTTRLGHAVFQCLHRPDLFGRRCATLRQPIAREVFQVFFRPPIKLRCVLGFVR